jgi:hypothetical protein
MGQAKKEELEKVAMDVLIKAGALAECEKHKGTFVDEGDPEAVSQAYATANEMVKAKEVDATRDEFMDAIKTALENAGEECPLCAEEEGGDE